MASRKLLVITGDYSVVQQVKQVLGGSDFTIHTAYSHLDALYQLKYETFELVLADASMIHRKNGEQTAATVAQMDKRPPLLSFICGLGGREVTLEDVAKAADMCYAAAKAGKSDPKTHWLGVRE